MFRLFQIKVAHCMAVTPLARNTAAENLTPIRRPISVSKITLKLSFVSVHSLHTKETANLTASQSALQSAAASWVLVEINRNGLQMPDNHLSDSYVLALPIFSKSLLLTSELRAIDAVICNKHWLFPMTPDRSEDPYFVCLSGVDVVWSCHTEELVLDSILQISY